VNKGSAPVFTQVHEFAEIRFKEIFDADGGASAVAAARVVAPLFDPAKATNPADKAFAERLQSIAAGKVNGTPEEVATIVRETMIDLAVANELGQRKDGGRLPAGAVSNAILDRIRMYGRSEQAAREVQVAKGEVDSKGDPLPLLQKFAGILKAVRHYLRGVFAVAAKLQKARRDGLIKDGDDFQAFADKLLGLDTVKAHEAAVVREAGGGQTFSVQPATEGGAAVTPAQDAEYMAAVESGDVAKQQAMVDAAAKAAGYNVGPVYHSGTSWTQFDPKTAGLRHSLGLHLGTESQVRDMGTIRKEKDVKRLFARLRNPIRLDDRGIWDYDTLLPQLEKRGIEVPPDVKYGREQFSRSPYGPPPSDEYRTWSHDRVRTAIIEAGYDGAVYLNESEGIDHAAASKDKRLPPPALRERESWTPEIMRDYGAEDSYIIFNPSQIKSADPITRDAAGNVIPLSQRFNHASDSISYSIGSVNTLEAIAAQFEERLAAGGPAAKLEAYADTARTLAGMARAARANEETEKILRVGEIERERPKVEKRLRDEYTDEVYRAHGDLMSQPELASAFENPLVDYVFRAKEAGKPFRRSRILSRAAAERKGIDIGNQYDGTDGLPRWLFSSDGLMPDKIAAEIAETGQFGFPEDANADADLWPALHQVLTASEKYRKALRKIEGEISDAKDRARVDAREWANKERWKLSTSDVRDSRRSIVTLDAMLMHLPAEVRGKVGGFTAITDLKSNDARRRHFLRMIDRIDSALEDYLRKEYLKAIHETFEKGKAKRAYGEKDRGKLGVNAHTWLETAQAVMAMGETALSTRESHLDAILGGKEMTAAEIADLNRAWDMGTGEDAARLALEVEQGILDLFGGITHREDGRYIRTAGEIEAALKAARETVETGRQAWDKVLIERRERRAGRRAGVKIDSKNDGSLKASNPDVMPEKVNELRFHYQMASTEQLMGYIFGRKSDTHLWVEDEVLTSRLTAEGLFQDAQRKVSELLDRIWPRTGSIGRIHNLEKLSTRAPVPGAEPGTPNLSELDVVHFTMLWADEGSRQWMRKHHLGDGEPLDPRDEKGVDVQAAFEAFLSPEAKVIRAWLQEQYDAQYDTLNDVYRRIHGVNMPRVRNYAPRMVLHGKDTVVIDPMGSGGLSARGVFAGFTKRRRPDVSAAPVVANALAAFMQNQRVVSHFVGWAESSSDLRAVLSTSETAPFILGAAGPDGVKALNLRLSDLEAGGVRDAMALAFHGEFMRALVDNALIGKVAPLLKQAVNTLASSTEIGFGKYARSARRLLSGKAAATLKEIAQMPIMKQRAHNMAPEILQASYGLGVRRWTRRLRRMRINTTGLDLTMSWLRSRMGWADALFNLRSAAIAYDSHWLDAKELKMGDDAAHAYALKEMTRTVSRTSQPDHAADRSLYENHSSKPAKVLFAFQTMNRAMLSSTIASFKAGDIPAFARKSFVFWAVNGLIMQAIASAIKDVSSDDDEDEDWKVSDFIRSMALGPLTGALYLGPIIDAASSWISAWFGAGGFEPREASVAQELNKAKHAVESIATMFAEDFPEDNDFDLLAKRGEAAVRGAGFAGQVAGGGWWSGLNVMANVFRQARGVADNLVTTAGEAEERKAKAYREADKEARKAREATLTDEERAALRKHREETKAIRQQQDAAKWDALNP